MGVTIKNVLICVLVYGLTNWAINQCFGIHIHSVLWWGVTGYAETEGWLLLSVSALVFLVYVLFGCVVVDFFYMSVMAQSKKFVYLGNRSESYGCFVPPERPQSKPLKIFSYGFNYSFEDVNKTVPVLVDPLSGDKLDKKNVAWPRLTLFVSVFLGVSYFALFLFMAMLESFVKSKPGAFSTLEGLAADDLAAMFFG